MSSGSTCNRAPDATPTRWQTCVASAPPAWEHAATASRGRGSTHGPEPQLGASFDRLDVHSTLAPGAGRRGERRGYVRLRARREHVEELNVGGVGGGVV